MNRRGRQPSPLALVVLALLHPGLSGCGRIGFDPARSASDAAADAPMDRAAGPTGDTALQPLGDAGAPPTDGFQTPGAAADLRAPTNGSDAAPGAIDQRAPDGPESPDGRPPVVDAPQPDDAVVPLEARPAGPALVQTASFVGTGAAGTAVTGVGFRPDVLFVHSAMGGSTTFASSSMPAGTTRILSNFGGNTIPNFITQLTPDGFVLGSNGTVNMVGVTYHYLALRAAVGTSAVGRYVGTGTVRSLSGLGFTPAYVMIVCEGRNPVHRARTMPTSYRLNGTTSTGLITALQPDGFQLGPDRDTNESGNACDYLVFREDPARIVVTSYVGDRADNRVITTGVAAEGLFLQCINMTGFPWMWRARSIGVDTDGTFQLHNDPPRVDSVQRLLPGGFEVGTDPWANGGGLPCHAISFVR